MLKPHDWRSLSILSGILIGTSYIPFPPWALFFCLVPLWMVWWNAASMARILISGWLTQFVLTLIGFHWIAYTVVEFGRMPWPVGILILILFCTVAHLHYPIAGLLWFWLKRRAQLSPLAQACALVLIFALTERFYPFLFYWHLGYPWLWASLPGYHLAEWVGFFGLNFLTLCINIFILHHVRRDWRNWRSPALLGALSLMLSLQIVGHQIGQKLPPTDETLNVLAVQGNIGNLDKILAEHNERAAEKATDIFINLTQTALRQGAKPDLVVWPETAFPEMVYPQTMGRQRRRLHLLAAQGEFDLLTGAYEYRDGKPFNSIVLLDGERVKASYQKTHLLAFGEHFPFADTFPILRTWFPMVADFGRGPGPIVIAEDRWFIAPQICYEGLFDEFSLQQRQKGAHFFINVTNDSWYGHTFESYQHMYMTLARAVENRIPMIRVTNTGITTVALASGEVMRLSPQKKEWAHLYQVPFHSTPALTLYARLGLWWPWILVLGLLLTCGGDWFVRTRQHRLGKNSRSSR